MSTELIPTFEGELDNRHQTLCNARDLHAFLEVGREFTSWIKDHIGKYDLQEGCDYAIIELREPVPHQGGTRLNKKIEYHLGLDVAKELAMASNSERGSEVRHRSIFMEKLAKARQSSIGIVRQYGYMPPEAVLTAEEKLLLLTSRKDWAFINNKVLAGWSSAQIADKLNLSESGVRRTIRRQRQNGCLPPDPRKVALLIERKLLALNQAG